MNKNIVVIIAVVFLTVSGLALSKMMGIGGGCCSTHHAQDSK